MNGKIGQRRETVKANRPEIIQNLKQGFLSQQPEGWTRPEGATWQDAVAQVGQNPQVQQAMGMMPGAAGKPLRVGLAAGPKNLQSLMGSTGPVNRDVLKNMWR